MTSTDSRTIPDMSLPTQLSHGYHITAAGCDAARRLPPSTLVADIIDLAVAHADRLGVGYAAMAPHGIMWVMGRLSIAMDRWPAMGDDYRLTTWVEGINRLFSERDFEIAVDGAPAGYARTIWSAIDMTTRRAAQLTPVTAGLGAVATPGRPCHVAKAGRLPLPSGDVSTRRYTFALSDLDFNRHVTTTRYVDLMVDSIPLDLYDRSALRRIDLAFHREARYADTVAITSGLVTDPDGSTVITAAITDPDNLSAPYTGARIILTTTN